jgi:hypothetical protein
VFSLQLGWRPVVVLNGLAAVREALVNRSEDTADRPPMPVNEHLGYGPRSKGKHLWGPVVLIGGQGGSDQRKQDLMGVVIWSSDTRKSPRIAGQRLQK